MGLSQIDLSKLLSVTVRTVNRWYNNPNEISGTAEQALRSWMRLKSYNLNWIPDEFLIIEKTKRLIMNKSYIIKPTERTRVNVIIQDRKNFVTPNNVIKLVKD